MTSRLRTALRRYVRQVALTLSPGTVRGELTAIDSFISFLEERHPEVKKLSMLQRNPHVEGWLQRLASRDPPYAPATRNRTISCVARFLRTIAESGSPDVPPDGLINSKDLPRCDKHLPRALSPEVDLRLLEALRKDGDVRARGLLLARLMGLRIGELRRLELDCLIEGMPGPVVRVPLGKLHQDRVVPVDDEVVRLIKEIQAARPRRRSTWDARSRRMVNFLLPDRRGRPISRTMWRKKLLAVVATAGITEHIWPHRLRHTYATVLLGSGVSLPALMKLLGHKSILMTMRYVQLTAQEVQRQYLLASQKAKERYAQLPARPKGAPPITDDSLDSLVDQLVARLDAVRREQSCQARRKRLARLLEQCQKLRERLRSALA
jgi:site-specific recombinase XerD